MLLDHVVTPIHPNTIRYAAMPGNNPKTILMLFPQTPIILLSNQLPLYRLQTRSLSGPSFDPRRQIPTLTDIKTLQLRASINDTFNSISRDSDTSSNAKRAQLE